MAIFRTVLRMASDIVDQVQRKWGPTFYVEAASPTAAATALAVGWADSLRQTCRERVYAYEVYATDLAPLTDNYTVVSIAQGSQRGALVTPAPAEPYLPKVCVAVTLLVENSRPSRKFWRPGLYEVDITNGVTVAAPLLASIRDNFSIFVESFNGFLVDPDGQPITGVGPLRLTTREYGRESTVDVPTPPPLG